MAVPKRKMIPCMVQVACDGAEMLSSSSMCGKCRHAIRKKTKAAQQAGRLRGVNAQ